MKNYFALLEPECTYHIYNHSNGFEKLFLTEENYLFFLIKYIQYIYPIVDTFSYCLMPNHFHFLIKVKTKMDLIMYFTENKIVQSTLKELEWLDNNQFANLISRQFSHLFNCYTQSFNKENKRFGSLFCRPFKRKFIDSESYFCKVVHYIHYNPVESGLCKKPEDWKFSSFKAIISDIPSLVDKVNVINCFDDIENFIYCHREPPESTGINF